MIAILSPTELLPSKYKITQCFKKERKTKRNLALFSVIIDARDPLAPFEVNKACNTTRFSNLNAKGDF